MSKGLPSVRLRSLLKGLGLGPATLWLRRFLMTPGPRYSTLFLYYRHRNAPLILKTKPVRTPAKGDWAVRYLTCKDQVLETVWAAKSLYRYVDVPLYFHEDGTFDRACFQTLREHFPDATIIPRRESDERTLPLLSDTLRSWRQRLIFFLRVFDFQVMAQGQPYLQLDTDVLFFARPDELLRRGTTARFNCGMLHDLSHLAWDYSHLLKHTGMGLTGGFNAGLLYFPHTLNFKRVQHWLEVLGEPRLLWGAEQTILNIEAAIMGMTPLGPEYEIWEKMQPNFVSIHYVQNSRLNMYRNGYPMLYQVGI
jgi:hypothetical protein